MRKLNFNYSKKPKYKKTDYIVCFKTLKIISIVGSIHDYD